jgi:hypothetical protein
MKNLNAPKHIIFLDLDGVVCDFLEAASKLTGVNMKNHKDWQKIRGSAWRKICDEGESFWSDLPWTKDGKELWNFIKEQNVSILSAYPTMADGHSKEQMRHRVHASRGKRAWCKKNLGVGNHMQVHIVKGVQKQAYARAPHFVLIDDSIRNIRQWRKRGGIGIHHTSAAKTIETLKAL